MEIELRQIEKEDLATLRDWRNSREVRERCREYRLLNMLNQSEWWERMTQERETEMFAIARVRDHTLVGICGLTHIHWVNRSAEVSIIVGRQDCRRHGVGLSTLFALEELAFDQYNLHRLWAEIYEFNTPSIRLFQKARYTCEGVMVDHVFWHGRYHDAHIYGLVSEEEPVQ